jgi:menaquinone-dependent protoporphyrinogen IX oxidase
MVRKMRILVGYCSDNGSAKYCAQQLKARITAGDVELADLDSRKPKVADYDCVILGSAIRMGQVSRKLKHLMKKQQPALLQKPLFFYINCVFPENVDAYFAQNIPEELRRHASACLCFGGKLDMASLQGKDWMFASAVTRQAKGSGRSLTPLDDDAITRCAQAVDEVLLKGETS